jgi:hypothetical protein
MFDEVIKYLAENLEISIEQNTEFGPVEYITVKLELGGNIISTSECEIPHQKNPQIWT